jgi:hypothetical protein
MQSTKDYDFNSILVVGLDYCTIASCNALKTEKNPLYIYIFSSYLTENKMCFVYKDKSMSYTEKKARNTSETTDKLWVSKMQNY